MCKRLAGIDTMVWKGLRPLLFVKPMPDLPSLPFEIARCAAESLEDVFIKSQLLSELAQQQLLVGQFDAALKTFAAIPSPEKRRTALLVSDFGALPPGKVEPLVRLLEAAPQTDTLAGRLALALLESKNVTSAWKLVEMSEAFETEQQRYEFLEKVLPQAKADDWEMILRFYRQFAPGTYQDWALLAIIKYLTEQQRYDKAEQFVGLLALPLRRSWGYWEISRLVPAEQTRYYFDKAVAIIELIAITPNEEEMMETLASQLRIFGRAALHKGWKEQGERLLERSEAATASLTLPMQRYRLQCFLGKVLVEIQQIESIQNYVAIDKTLESLRSSSDRSRVLVWLAEAGWNEGWSKAIEVLVVPERGNTDSERVKQITDVIKRFVAHYKGNKATGNSSEDTVLISGEEFETLYFNPFAEADCGCY